ncbi:hypothetical protein BDN71DRAFT_1431974 [Pleurotus eryngii]|uniref:Uncharacterized protein n=1 Tax=Pleurotus eryngii TaxID=5323 RepID=A0A9P5ZV08_PLEER|nr:hypothetical protein BDN71DRAFT_1431974 [Pleurotus eryngii]
MPSIITQAPVRNQAYYMDFATFQLGADPTAGQSDENPIVLNGISKVDFERFLGVAIVVNYQGEPPAAFGIPHWLSVLKLANLWGFHSLRRKAIEVVSSGGLCREAQGYTELVDRREMMTEAEVGEIGWNAMLKICKLREEFYSLKQPASSSSGSSSARLRFVDLHTTTPGPQDSTIHSSVTSASAVRQAFAAELEEIRAVADALMVHVAGNSDDSDLGSEPDART